MSKQRDAQLISFGEFVTHTWQPAMRRAKTTEHADEQIALGELCEAVLWLRLGVQLDFYPSATASLLLKEDRDLKTMIYRAGGLELLFPPILWSVLNGDILDSSMESQYERVQDSHKLFPYFQTALGLAGQMNEDQLGREFRTRLVLSKGGPVWEKYLDQPLNHDLVQRCLSVRARLHRISSESLIAGFFRTLDAMAMWARFFETIRMDRGLEIRDRSMLRRNVGQVTCWRLNLRDDTAKMRLARAAEIAQPVFEYACVVSGLTPPGRTMFLDNVKALIHQWLEDHPYLLTHGAGH